MQSNRKTGVWLVLLAVLVFFQLPAWAAENQKIDINTATVEELAQLNRVGAKYAERIVAYREANGPFKNPMDITNVKGIGQKIYEANKDIITVSKAE